MRWQYCRKFNEENVWEKIIEEKERVEKFLVKKLSLKTEQLQGSFVKPAKEIRGVLFGTMIMKIRGLFFAWGLKHWP